MSGSNPIFGAIPEIEEAAPDATWEEGHRFTSSDSESQIAAALGL